MGVLDVGVLDVGEVEVVVVGEGDAVVVVPMVVEVVVLGRGVVTVTVEPTIGVVDGAASSSPAQAVTARTPTA